MKSAAWLVAVACGHAQSPPPPLQIATPPASPEETAYFTHVTVASFGYSTDEQGYALIFGQHDLPPLPPRVEIIATFHAANGETATSSCTHLTSYRGCEGRTGCWTSLAVGLSQCEFAKPPLLATPGDYKVTFRSTGGALHTGAFGLVVHEPAREVHEVDHWR